MGEQLGAESLRQVVDIVDRLEHGQAEVLLPEAIGDVGGEARVLRAGQPAGETIAQLGGRLGAQLVDRQAGVGLVPGDEHGAHGRPGLGVLVLVVLGEGEFLRGGVLEAVGVHVADALDDGLGERVVLAHGPAELREHRLVLLVGGPEERGELVEVPLRPVGERMVMALRARHVGAEERREQVGDAIQRHLGVEQQEARGAVVAQAAIGGEHLHDQLVPGRVGGEAGLQPVLEGEGGHALVEGILHAEQVGHPVEHLHRVPGRVHELIDELGALVGRTVGEERLGLRGGRDAADGVDVETLEELLVGRQRVRLLAMLGEHGADHAVDLGRGDGDGVLAEGAGLGLGGALPGELDVLGAKHVAVEMVDLAVATLEGQERTGERAEHRVDAATLVVAPGMPDGIQRRDRGHGDRSHLRGGDRGGGLVGLGGLLVTLGGEGRRQDAKTKGDHAKG